MKTSIFAFIAVAGLVAAACGGDTNDVGGVAGQAGKGSGGSGATGGSGGSGGTGATGGSGATGGQAGSGGSECPADIFGSVGKPCSEEGKNCSPGACDACQFCPFIKCMNGVWEQMEAFPDPNCNDGGGQTCGGLADIDCPEGFFCDYFDCSVSDAQGVCVKKPDGCPADCPGVCGCDGKPYCNQCTANAQGMDVTGGKECMN